MNRSDVIVIHMGKQCFINIKTNISYDVERVGMSLINHFKIQNIRNPYMYRNGERERKGLRLYIHVKLQEKHCTGVVNE